MAKTKWARPQQGGPIVIPNCAMWAFKFTQQSMTLKFILHGSLTQAGPLNPSVAETAFTSLKANAATTTWLTHVTTGCSLAGIDVKDLRSANQPTLSSTSAAVPGTGAGAALPQDNAFAITLRTAFSGRGYVGRAYLMGLTITDVADSRHWASTLGTPAVNFLNACNTAMTAAGMPWVLGRRTLLPNSDPSAPPPYNQMRNADTIPITAAVARDYRIDSQRKRLGR